MFIHLIPGDPARLVAGKEATSYEVEIVREQLGLNKPLLQQYLLYMRGLFTLDLGNSIRNGATVYDTIAPRFLPTVQLTILAIVWSVLVGTLLGILAAVKRGKFLDYLSMYLGTIVELADKRDLYARPIHPYTQALLSAVPEPDPTIKKDRILLEGDIPSPVNPPSGCLFHTRCAYCTERCRQERPEAKDFGNGHMLPPLLTHSTSFLTSSPAGLK